MSVVDVAVTCRWCEGWIVRDGLASPRSGWIHAETGRAECHGFLASPHARPSLAQPVLGPPPEDEEGPKVPCSICHKWVPVRRYTEHWGECLGPPPPKDPKRG